MSHNKIEKFKIQIVLKMIYFQYIKQNQDGTLTVFSGDQNTENKTYDFIVWSGLLRDFARRQNFVKVN